MLRNSIHDIGNRRANLNDYILYLERSIGGGISVTTKGKDNNLSEGATFDRMQDLWTPFILLIRMMINMRYVYTLASPLSRHMWVSPKLTELATLSWVSSRSNSDVTTSPFESGVPFIHILSRLTLISYRWVHLYRETYGTDRLGFTNFIPSSRCSSIVTLSRRTCGSWRRIWRSSPAKLISALLSLRIDLSAMYFIKGSNVRP